MYAVIRSGNHQFRVNEGDLIKVPRFDAEVGAEVTLSEVLLLGGGDTVVGTPTVPGASVTARVTGQGRHPKIIVFKMKRRKTYRRKRGHRQHFTALQITGIHYDPSAAN
jgi:large subunit ribosomal protein L21